ncbi:MAG: LPS export ABC transporter periplasmic protein LptC [Ferruginibacter sp.]
MKILFTHIFFKAALIIGCFFLPSCTNKQQDIDKLYKKKLGVEEAINVKVNFTTGGRPKAVLTSPLMLRVQDSVPYLEFPKTLKVLFYNEAGIQESILTGMYAKYKERDEIVYIRDSVQIRNINGDTLYCEELYWNRNRTGKEFYTDKPVRIRTRTQTLNGIGMEARQDFKDWKIIHPLGVIKVAGGPIP